MKTNRVFPFAAPALKPVMLHLLIVLATTMICLPPRIEAQVAVNGPATTPFTRPPDDVGPNHRTWNFKSGAPLVELCTGMNYWEPTNQSWMPSDPSFAQGTNGFAASHVQAQVWLSPDINVIGAVGIQTLDGIVLRSTTVAIGLLNRSNGQFAVIGTITNSLGVQVATNQIEFENCFAGSCCASVVYTMQIGSFAQDIVFTGKLDPAAFGFPRETCRIQIFSELYQAPEPDTITRPIYVEENPTLRAGLAVPDLMDELIGFGQFVLGNGRAYVTPSLAVTNGAAAVVGKEFVKSADGRVFIVESVDYTPLQEGLLALPDCAPTGGSAKVIRKADMNSGLAAIPSPQRSNAREASLPVQGGINGKSARRAQPAIDSRKQAWSQPVTSAPLAAKKQSDSNSRHAPEGVTIDYIATLGGSLTGTVLFAADTNYFVNGNVYCNGQTIIEPTIFKFKASGSSSLIFNNTVTCKTSMFRKCICTGVDDDTVGDSLNGNTNSGYTGTINLNGYGNPMIQMGQTSLTLNNFRFCYAKQAIVYWSGSASTYATLTVSHSQFVNCIKAIEIDYAGSGSGSGTGTIAVNVNNALMAKVKYPVTLGSIPNPFTSSLINCTVDQSSQLGYGGGSSSTATLNSLNSIFADVTNNTYIVTLSGNNNGFYNSGQHFGSLMLVVTNSPFQSVGAGNYYLTSASGMRNAGTNYGVPASLLSDLQRRTTYPPAVIGPTNLNTAQTFSIQATRDSPGIDLGAHYDPIDLALSGVLVTNATVTVTNGAVIAAFGTNGSPFGLGIGHGATLQSQGTPNNPNWFVQYNTVQEQPVTNWFRTTNGLVISEFQGLSPGSTINCRFTDFSVPSLDAPAFYAPTNNGPFNFQDCEFHSGKLVSARPTVNFTNVLLERVDTDLEPKDSLTDYVRVGLVYGGSFTFAASNSLIEDVLFDSPAITNWNGYTGGFNAYVTNWSRLQPTQSSDIILTSSPPYQAGPFGSYYQLTNSILINADTGTTADKVGLYHYTVCTNLANGYEVKETNSLVDLSYHYVATDASGNPIDSNDDGIPDYVSDANGDGIVQGNEIPWYCLATPSNIISWWRAEGDAVDSVGGNDGKILGAANPFAQGQVGEGFSWAYSGCVHVPSNPTLNLTGEFTIELWYNATTRDPNYEALFGKCSPLNENYYVGIYPQGYLGLPDWALGMGFYDPTAGPQTMFYYPAPSINSFHHVAASYRQVNSTSIEMKMYVDGTCVAVGTYPGNFTNTLNNAPFTIGTSDPRGTFFTGIIDEVAIYSRALTTNEIAGIYNAGLTGEGKCVPISQPVITVQPTNQTVSAGSDVLLAALAAGTPPRSYQWYSNAVAVANATNNLFIINDIQQASTNWVVVSNLFGTATSQVPTITITNALCFSAPSNMIAWWRAESNTLDQVGGNNGFLINGADYTTGKVGSNAFDFPGYPDGSVLIIPDSPTLTLTNELTFEFWFKGPPDSPGGGFYGLLDKYQFAGVCSSQSTAQNYALQIVDEYMFQLTFCQTNSSQFQGLTYWPTPVKGMFHHIAGTYRQQTNSTVEVRLYIDGQPVLTNTLPGDLAYTISDTPVSIGAVQSDGGAAFPGIIDEISMYSRALSASEILAIYNGGSAGKCLINPVPQIITQPTGQTVPAGTDILLSVFASGAPPLTYQWRFNGAGITGATNSAYIMNTVQSSQAGNYNVLVTNSQGSVLSQTGAVSVTTAPPCIPPPSGIVAWWRAEGDGSDFIGTNNGTIIGPTSFVSGEDGQAISFDGNQNFLQVTNPLFFTNEFTVELWYKDNGASSAYGLISKFKTYGDFLSSFNILVWPNSYLEAGFLDATYNWQMLKYTPVPAAGMYHHLAATYKQTDAAHITVNLYLDGQCAAEEALPGNMTNTFSDAAVTIGAGSTVGWYMDGNVDEASIYSRALSASEIQAIYNAGSSGKCLDHALVTFTNPTNSELFVISPTNILLSVTVQDFTATVTNVTFTTGSTTIGQANASPWQVLMTNIQPGNYTVTATAKDSLGLGGSNSVTFTNNAMPVVSITFPTNGQSFTQNANVTITGSDSDPGGSVQQIQLYWHSNYTDILIGTIPTPGATFSLTWSNLAAGTYPIWAFATDNVGASTASPITIFNVKPTHPPPYVQITSPSSNMTFAAGSDITITATATNWDNSVTNVVFLVETNLLGMDADPPYSVTKCCWGAGSYSLVAIAMDVHGATGVSQPIPITVGAIEPKSSADFWDPIIGSTVYFRYPTVSALALDTSNNLYAGGDVFTFEPPVLPSNETLVEWDGNIWRGLNGTNGNPHVSALTLVGDTLYGGMFGLSDANYTGSGVLEGILQINGTNWTLVSTYLVGSSPDISPCRIASIGSELFVVGDFVGTTNDSTVQYVAKLVGTNWMSVGNGLTMPSNGAVRAVASVGSTIYIGGDFTAAGGNTNIQYIAKLVGTNWTNVGGGVNAPVRTLAGCDKYLYAGGDFTTAEGNTNANHVARWDGQYWSTIGSGVTGGTDATELWPVPSVLTLSVRGNQLFVGGEFTNALNADGPVAVNNVALATWDEALQSWTWSALDTGANSIDWGAIPYVSASVLSGSPSTNIADYYIGGWFDHVGSVRSPKIAHWEIGRPQPPAFPALAITTPTNFSVFSNQFNITATASGFGTNQITAIDIYIDQGDISSVAPNQTNSYTFNTDSHGWLSFAGQHTITALAKDNSTPPREVNSSPVYFTYTGTSTLTAQDDFFTVFSDSPQVDLNVLANDSTTTTNPLIILEAVPLLVPSGSIQVSYDSKTVVFKPSPNTFGMNTFIYLVTDGTNTASAYVSVLVKARPQVAILNPVDGFETSTSSVMSVNGTSASWDGTITNVSLYLNGAPYAVTNNPNFNFSFSTNTVSFYTFVAVATDNDGYTNASTPVMISVTNNSTTTDVLTATITNLNRIPTNAFFVYPLITNGSLDLRGMARDSNTSMPVTYQVLLLRPTDENNTNGVPLPFANVTPPPLNAEGFHVGTDTNGDLGTLDLSLVPNGVYDVELVVQGSGAQTNATARVLIDSGLKIGQFSFSEQDLVLPVNGIPITITRTYNSLNPLSSDFGYGWTFAINSMDVELDDQRQNVTIGSDQAPVADQGGDANEAPLNVSVRTGGGWDVTLTLPDGRRTTFAFTPVVHTSGYFVTAQWTPPIDVHATLTPLGNNADKIYFMPINLTPPYWADDVNGDNGFPPLENHDIPGWVLTTQDGAAYNITRGRVNDVFYDPTGNGQHFEVHTYGPPQLTSIVQRTGDTINIQTNGIFHYAAGTNGTTTTNLTRSVLFNRDSQGRIAAIFDPNSGANGLPAVRYVYHADTGNLLQVLKLVDRNAGTYATNKYIYANQQFPHYITEIDNGIGVPITRNFYDSIGRLAYTVDANNNTNQFIHNLTNSIELFVDRLGHTNTTVYDSRGNVTAKTNALNGVTLSAYDAANNKTNEVLFLNGTPYATDNFTYDPNTGLMLSSINSLGFTKSFAYNSFGQVTNTVVTGSGSWTNYFDGNGNLIGTTDALGNSTTNIYDSNSLLVSSTDAAGAVTTNQYDSYGNPTSTRTGYYSNNTFVALTSTGYAYDSNGNQVAMTNALQVVTCYGFDGQNRLIATTNNAYGSTDRTVTLTIFDAAGRIVQTVDALGVTNVIGYDFAGNQTSLTRALGTPVQQASQSGYDADGNKTSDIDNLGHETDYQYDALNHQTVALFPAASSGASRTGTTNAYDGQDRRIAITNQAGVGSGFQFDVLNRLTAVTNALGKLTQYQWDPLGNETNQIDALNRSTKFTFDALSRRTQRMVPGSQAENFTYDSGSRLLRQTNFDGTIITNQYDVLGQLLKRCNGATVLETYAYDAAGQLTNRTDASGTYTWVYDVLGRLKTNSTPVGTLYYTYDANGNLLTLSSATANGVSLTYQYDSLNRLTNVIDNRLTGTKNTGYAFDGVGNLQSLAYPNGYSAFWQYDPLNRLTNLVWVKSSTTNASFAYQLGPAGNRTNLADNVNGTARTFSWGYDNAYRLTNETVSGGSPTGTLGYVYDDVGNRTSRTGSLGSLTASNNTFDVNDWLDNDSITNNANPYFDANGNMRTNGSVYYGYDWANRLTGYTNGAAVATMIYAADGNRSQRTSSGTTTLYLVATVNPSGYSQVVEEFTVSGGTTNLSMVYSYGLGLISQRQAANGTVSFFGSDGLGSTRFLTSTNGTITETYAYDAYGTLIASNTTPSTVYLFTGQQTDPVLGGLLNLRQRHNITTLGRFLTRDAVPGTVQEPLSLHQYIYVANNPANNTDPSGNTWLDATRLGTAVHGFIGKDFVGKTLGGLSGKSVATALGLPVTITAFFPDLVDVRRRQVYEIKPNGVKGFVAGEAQLQTYLELFNTLDPRKRKWKEGSSYTAPPLFLVSAPLVPPTFIEAEPPIFGVILYSSIQDYVGRKARNVAVEENAEMDDSVGISVLDAFLGGLF